MKAMKKDSSDNTSSDNSSCERKGHGKGRWMKGLKNRFWKHLKMNCTEEEI